MANYFNSYSNYDIKALFDENMVAHDLAKEGVADEKSEELIEFLNEKRKVEIVEKTPQKLSDVISESSEKSKEL